MKKNRGSSRSSSSSSSESSSSSSSESSSRSRKVRTISKKREESKAKEKETTNNKLKEEQINKIDVVPVNNIPLRMAVSNLTKNINEEHLKEIFSNYGIIKKISLLNRKSNIEYEKLEEYELAHKCMNKGQIDGKIIRIDLIYENEKTAEKIIKSIERVTTRKKQRSPNRKYEKSPRRKYSSSRSSRKSRSARKK
jgi:RNA-binding protein with serine-rich domain 1